LEFLDVKEYHKINTIFKRDQTTAESAFAALAAIAEPSREMLRAAVSLYPGLSPRVAAAIWRAMHASMMTEKDTGE
jgi:hypothetical protein